ncbi:response regulator [Terrimonas sp. NA20]|uniref:histidine kinase n=1 Tax=Terrimonas ginsenosidimutans TaxID=2908004 RepID=A0ABS9KS74_9BACT|nr:response regulator [Terrimonas ginsenosidimutans]MCG2615120.1 response regulator [Terrimonas ginsenosidimutans]
MKPISTLPFATTFLRILILEDDSDHAFVIRHRLERDRGDCAFLITSAEEDFRHALQHFSPDVIITDNSLPGFNAFAALRVARELRPEAICILVTALLLEDQAIDYLREGGDDCLDKSALSRLCSSVATSLARRSKIPSASKGEKQQMKRADIFRSYLEHGPDGLLALDTAGYIMHINDAAGQLLSGKAWSPAGNLVWDVFPEIKDSFFGAAFTAVLQDAERLAVRLYLTASDSWLDCFFQPVDKGMTVLIKDVTREENLLQELREQQGQMQYELDQLSLVAGERERHLLGQELHDNVNQLLASANLYLTLISEAPERASELVPYCKSSVLKAIEENRRLAHGLISSDEDKDALMVQVERLCETLLRPAGIAVELQTECLNEARLGSSFKLELYRILQEHCTNIVKHSKANRVSMHLNMDEKEFTMTIADNGVGASFTDAKNKGVGLLNIEKRAKKSGGKVTIATSPGNGFTLAIILPV